MKRAGRDSAGFTLVEVVIAATLLSLIMLGALAALRTFGKTSESLESRVDGVEEIVAVSNFLRQAATTMARGRPAGAKQPAVVVEGNTGELLWLGILPARYGAGGLHYFRLAARRDERGATLNLWFAPYVADADPSALLPGEPQFRLDGLQQFNIRYRGQEQDQWRDEWTGESRLPAQIAFQLATAGAAWPLIVVAPLLLESGSQGRGEIVIGGSAP